MLADTTDIHAFGIAQHRHAADLTAVAADLSAARVPADAFGSVGARFVTVFNAALQQHAQHLTHIADRFAVAGSTAKGAADAYRLAEDSAGQSISAQGS